jgi:3-hydroxyacyl-CoA dehydrogenase/enoyl-CoA hydratase/3-hydroxybutyryl-CoA epimerase
MMGAGIAHACAARGIECVLHDVSLDKAASGRAAAVAKGRGVVAELIRITESVADLRGCDLVVEAVFEQRELKERIVRQVEPLLAAGGVYASNTSTLPITGLAAACTAPERFAGMHFFSPVEKMKLVEIIRGERTSDDTVARVFDAALALGKVPIVVNDGRGFYTSRVFGAYVMEAASMLAEGIAAPLVEHAALAAGMPVGPLEVLDQTSLSLSLHVLEQTRADFAAEGRRYEASAGELLVERMVRELGRSGRAAGGGFYDYPPGAPKRLWPGLKQHFESPSGARADLQELKDRLLYRQSIETVRCFADGVLTSSHDANVGALLGIGFPAWTGGTMQFVRSVGVGPFRSRAAALAQRHGARFHLDDAQLEAALAA